MSDSMASIMADVVGSAVSETVGDDAQFTAPVKEVAEKAPIPAKPREEDGKFAKRKTRDIDPTLTDEENAAIRAEDGEEAPAPAKTDEIVLPEGMVKVPTITGENLPFKVHDAEGELEVPALKIQYTANGKERMDDIPQLVKMAQWGAYNQEKEARFQQAATQSAAVVQENTRLQQTIEQQNAEREWLLSKDENYLAAREKYEAMNTPEARLQRQQEALQEQKYDIEFQQVAAQGERLFNEELVPAITQISQALPYVSPDELGAKLLLAIEPYRIQTRRGAIVPPRAHEAVRQMILNEIVPWAKELQETRTARFGTVTADATKKVAVAEAKAEKATVESQKSKNLATRTTRPVGRSQKEVAPKKPIVSVQDGMEDSVASALAAMGFDRS